MIQEHHSCTTYLRVVLQDFSHKKYKENVDEFNKKMDVVEECFKAFGAAYVRANSCLSIASNDRYNVDVNEMIRVTIKQFVGKEGTLKLLAKKLKVYVYLEIVPYIVHDSEEPNQYLTLDDDIIAFLYKSGVKLDLDYYIL